MRAGHILQIGSMLAVISGTALAQSALSNANGPSPADTNMKLAQDVVIGTSPLPGANIDIDKIPGNVQTLSASDLAKDGTPNLLGSMATQLSSVNINDTLADPY